MKFRQLRNWLSRRRLWNALIVPVSTGILLALTGCAFLSFPHLDSRWAKVGPLESDIECVVVLAETSDGVVVAPEYHSYEYTERVEFSEGAPEDLRCDADGLLVHLQEIDAKRLGILVRTDRRNWFLRWFDMSELHPEGAARVELDLQFKLPPRAEWQGVEEPFLKALGMRYGLRSPIASRLHPRKQHWDLYRKMDGRQMIRIIEQAERGLTVLGFEEVLILAIPILTLADKCMVLESWPEEKASQLETIYRAFEGFRVALDRRDLQASEQAVATLKIAIEQFAEEGIEK
ncbi:MAG: hypothetical protein FD180_2794 [Planctomycetota bacterium]|nr:MAG: hypothetical protein FD180_2794 [Planctomycetota bacterium]